MIKIDNSKVKLCLQNVGIKFSYKTSIYLNIFSFRIAYKHTPHGVDVYPQAAAGFPLSTLAIATKGNPITNLQEDLAAEKKAQATYENLIDLSRDDPDVVDVLRYLREREIVHFQRFGEALRNVQDLLMEKRCFAMRNNNQVNK